MDALIGSSEMYISVWKLLGKKNRRSGIFNLHLFVYIQFTIYAMYCISCHEVGEVAGFTLR